MNKASKPSKHADDGDSDDGSTPKAKPSTPALSVKSLSPPDPSSPDRTPTMSKAKLAQGSSKKEGEKLGSAALLGDSEPDHPSHCACAECVSNHIHKAIKGMSRETMIPDKTLLGCVCEEHIEAGKGHLLECSECLKAGVLDWLHKDGGLAVIKDAASYSL